MHTQDLLAADTGMGAVTLRVADLDTMVAYYRDGVGLTVLTNAGGTAVLGRGSTPIVVLEHAPAMRHAAPHEAGLFHTAILFDTQADLAAALYSVATKYPQTFTGSADHLVSNAFYFQDPEGNGVELYWDRDRTEWSWTHGMVDMATIYVDPNAFVQEHLTSSALEDGQHAPRPGRPRAPVRGRRRHREGVLRRPARLRDDRGDGRPGAVVSAGGYHHHMAMNTWNSRGAGRRQQALGLGLVRIEVPGADDLGALVSRMHDTGCRPRTTVGPWRSRTRGRTASR